MYIRVPFSYDISRSSFGISLPKYHVIDANVRVNRTVSRKHAETRVRPVHFPRPSSRPTCTSWHADGEMVCFKRSKSFHGMRPHRISGYLRVSLGGPASGEPLEGKKKKIGRE